MNIIKSKKTKYFGREIEDIWEHGVLDHNCDFCEKEASYKNTFDGLGPMYFCNDHTLVSFRKKTISLRDYYQDKFLTTGNPYDDARLPSPSPLAVLEKMKNT